MASIDINGSSLEYVENGSGEPLVFVHGSASDYRTWQFQQDEFGKRFRTIAYSRRYHWPNQLIAEGMDYSMAEHVDDLQTLLHSLDAAPAHLVGHSYGAFLCLLLAIEEPHLIRTLVLTEPPVVSLFVSNPPKTSEILKLLVTRPRTAVSIIKFGAKGINPATEAAKQDDIEGAMRIFGKAVLGHEAYSRMAESRREQVRVNSIKAEFLGSGFAPLDADQVGSIDVPTLLIRGERSLALFHRLIDRLEELIEPAERVEISSASHIVHEDNPSAYNTSVLSFLARRHQAV